MTKLDVPLIDLKLHDINPLFTGSEVCEGGNFVGPLVRDHYLIHYVIKGTGVFSNATGDYPVKSRQIFLIRPGELYSYVSDKDDPWSYIWVGFNGAVAERLKALPSPVMDYREDTFFDLQKVNDMSSMREEFVTSRIYEILCVLFSKQEQKPHYVGQAQNYIRLNYMQPITAENVADFVGVSLRYLTRLFRGSTGNGVQDYIISTRLGHAKQFLSQGFSVSETAFKSGFNDAFHFSKAFKKAMGISPSEYKKKFLE